MLSFENFFSFYHCWRDESSILKQQQSFIKEVLNCFSLSLSVFHVNRSKVMGNVFALKVINYSHYDNNNILLSPCVSDELLNVNQL